MGYIKIAAVCAAAVLCCMGFAACGDKAEETSPAQTENTSQTTTAAAVSETVSTESPDETKAAVTEQAEETKPAAEPDPEKQRTVDSLKTLDEGVYSADIYIDYKLEDYLKANINNVDDFDAWLTENITEGVPTGGEKDGYRCSSFTAEDTEGHRIFGRNYDMSNGSSMIVRTSPKEGYASIGIADLSHLNIGKDCDYDIGDEKANSLLLAAPWGICDGVNEKGLGVSVLSLNEEHIVNDTEKSDLLIYAMTRVLLDRCADTDEATELLSGFDAWSPGRHTYHLFITDKSGKSVIVEWLEGEMHITEDNAVTNFVLHDNPEHTGDYDARYLRLRNKLDEEKPFTDDSAMELLLNVSQVSYTRWSAVYDLDDLSLTVCFDRDKAKTWSFAGRE